MDYLGNEIDSAGVVGDGVTDGSRIHSPLTSELRAGFWPRTRAVLELQAHCHDYQTLETTTECLPRDSTGRIWNLNAYSQMPNSLRSSSTPK